MRRLLIIMVLAFASIILADKAQAVTVVTPGFAVSVPPYGPPPPVFVAPPYYGPPVYAGPPVPMPYYGPHPYYGPRRHWGPRPYYHGRWHGRGPHWRHYR